MNEELLAQAQIIAEKLNDLNGLRFHKWAVWKLGFDTCYQLCSLTLDKFRRGEINISPGAYYNGCITREIRERGERNAA